MKTTIRIGLVVAALFTLLAIAVPAAGEPQADIVVDRADAIRQTTIGPHQTLSNLLSGVLARIVVDRANTLRHIDLPALSSDLQNRIAQVAARVVADRANAIRHEVLTAPAAPLGAALGQVASRVVMDKANANRELALSFPKSVVNDQTPPQVTKPTMSSGKLTWTSDEFTSVVVEYGTQPGVYTQSVADSQFARQREIVLPSVVNGVTYYLRITSTDLSGNVSTSQEFVLTGTQYLFLPRLQR